MQLYVLGPAFGLPSISAECIAAVALLQLRCPKEWRIIPTHDISRRLPVLVDDGGRHIEGFQDIAKYVTAQDSTLSDKQQADSVAITSFLESHAQTLLDILLFVSYENYVTTRSEFTKILPWYANYTIPPKLRTAARERTDHLGISSIDVDDVHEDLSNRPSSFDVGKEKTLEAEAQKRTSLLLPRKDTVRSLLWRPQHSAVFKLHALADNFFGPLQDILGKNEYLLGTEEIQIVDCLAYGYLSLMLYPKLPQDWLASTAHGKYPRLAKYTERIHQQLHMHTDAVEVMTLGKCKSENEIEKVRIAWDMKLPWGPPAISGVVNVAKTITRDIASHVPILNKQVELISASPQKHDKWRNYYPGLLAAFATGLGLLGYFALDTRQWIWPRSEEVHIFGRRRLADYGHLGAALAGMSFLGQQASVDATLHPRNVTDKPNRVEVEVEQDGIP